MAVMLDGCVAAIGAVDVSMLFMFGASRCHHTLPLRDFLIQRLMASWCRLPRLSIPAGPARYSNEWTV
jgi:hypothetical protein